MVLYKVLVPCFFMIPLFLIAGSETKKLEPGQSSPEASLEQLSWIAGQWEGSAFGGKVEEFWSLPSGDSMMGVFKLVVEGKTKFYEIMVIRQNRNSLVLQLKHFGYNLKGWEEKDDTVDFPLVEITENKVFFDGFTIKKINKNEIHLFVVISNNGQEEEVQFIYRRKPKR